MKYEIADGIKAAIERAQRVGHEINVYLQGEDIIVTAVRPDSVLVRDAKWIGQALPDGLFEWKTKQEDFT
jgi:hypothetical protein